MGIQNAFEFFFGNFVHPAKSYSSVTGLKADFTAKKVDQAV